MNKHAVQVGLARHSVRRPSMPRNYDHTDYTDKANVAWRVYDKRMQWWEDWYRVGRKLLKGAE